MVKRYTYTDRLLKDLLANNLVYVIVGVILCTILFYTKELGSFNALLSFILILLGLYLFINIPSIFLILNYRLENKDTMVFIYFNESTIAISQKNTTQKFHFDEITKSTYNLGIYYKDYVDFKNRKQLLHSDFGYWELVFNNKQRYYITNAVIDFIHNDPFIENTSFRYRWFPYVNKKYNREKVRELIFPEERKKDFGNKLFQQYNQKSISQLRRIIKDKKNYTSNAIELAEYFLNKKAK